MRTEKNKGTFWILGGVLLLFAALLLVYYNHRESQSAGEAAARIEAVILEELPIIMEENLSEPGLELEIDTPMYEKYETMEMPVKNVDGYNYIGIIEIPSLGISLPVMECWDDAGAKKAPCRYVGSVYQDNMIIAGHNYKRHFSPLHSIDIDAEVIFTDIDGNQFRYLVDSLETVGGNDRDTMLAGDWDLTLFTCTFTRVDRLAVRCSRVEE